MLPGFFFTLLTQYNSAKGNSSQAKINAMRRENHARNKGSINEQKRAAYAKRKTGLAMDLQFFAKVPDEKLKGYALNMELRLTSVYADKRKRHETI